jgi:aminopeptidase N
MVGAKAAFDDFYQRYSDDPLIIDKWFSLQAMTPDPATLDRVRALTGHPAFSMANPNRVRSLIGAFAQGNPTQFNRPDGAGYEFMADRILALDPNNPQVPADDHIQERRLERLPRPPRRRCSASPRRQSCRATCTISATRAGDSEVADIPAPVPARIQRIETTPKFPLRAKTSRC